MDMNTVFEKRRKFCRIQYDSKVNLDFNNGSYYGSYYDDCRIKNLSLTGMFVSGRFQAHKSDFCNVAFNHNTGRNHIRLKILCKTVWSQERGIGLKFISMTHVIYMLLKTLLIHNADRPATILKEFPEIPPFEINIGNTKSFATIH